MTEKEFTEIYEKLLELTKGRALEWKDMGNQNYELNFPRSSITLYASESPDDVVMNVLNEDGLLIATNSLFYDEDRRVRRFDLDTSELYNVIQSQMYKYSETAKDILAELKKLRRNNVP